jgi:thioredoxin-related protein
MIRLIPWVLCSAILSSSCAKLGDGKTGKKEEEPAPFGPTGIPPQLRARTSDPGVPVAPGGNSEEKPALGITPEEDIIYTDPDNPDAEIPELSTLLSEQKRGPWEQSEAIAKKRSVREGKPLLIWFTDSQRSPMCKALSQELFSKHEFGAWATEKLVRLRVDAAVKVEGLDMDLGSKETLEIERVRYIAKLKKRYKVLGYPTLVMLSPSGDVVSRPRGYKRGDAEYFWGLIKQAEVAASVSYQAWRTGLEKKGYREWQDRRGRKIFAKLLSYSKGTLVMVEPDGSRAQTEEVKLSDQDRSWIAEQKRIRNLQ